MATERDARALWRRQRTLVVLTAFAVAVAWLLVALVLREVGTEPVRWLADGTPAPPAPRQVPSLLVWATGAAVVGALGLLAAAVVHAARVVSFTFRRLD